MTNTQSPFDEPKNTGGSSPSPFNSATPQSKLPLGNSEIDSLKEMRIIKQAIAKSFIEAGHVKFTPAVEGEIKKWIRWCYQYDESLTK